MNRVWITLAIVSLALASASAAPPLPVTFAWATVGHPENPNDTHGDGYGAVDYAFRISKTEVTTEQYAEFLNHVADADPYGLYNPSMFSEYGCQIERHGSDGSYWYTALGGRGDRPVNYVSFWSACRFVNWLHNGQITGPCTAATTEAGAYDLYGYTGTDGRSITRHWEADYLLPSENEWYKAAYYDGSTYYNYPTGTDSVPSNNLVDPDPGNNANFHFDDDWTVGPPQYFTDVGEFENSPSPYGTFDQGGNVEEWTDTVETGGIWSRRKTRGGSCFDSDYYLRAQNSVWTQPHDGMRLVGFRVVQLLEPEDAYSGDFNFDTRVSDADYTIWADHYGEFYIWADHNFDHQVTDADYTIWADNYGYGMGSVPEPGCAALLMASALAMMGRRRKR
jgi:formylglycine-generating enzyme required for sulfatase activity